MEEITTKGGKRENGDDVEGVVGGPDPLLGPGLDFVFWSRLVVKRVWTPTLSVKSHLQRLVAEREPAGGCDGSTGSCWWSGRGSDLLHQFDVDQEKFE